MSEQTLKFGENVVNKKDFHASKQAITLDFVDTNNIVVSDKFKFSDDGCKYFIGSSDGDVIRPLCILLPQMSGYIKYFDNGGKNMSFKIENEIFHLKYTEIWNKIKRLLGTRFHNHPIYDEKYIKTKVKTFSGVTSTFFSKDELPKERNHYICIAAIFIDSVLKVENKNYPQVYLEQCKYKLKKRKPVDFIDAEVDLSSSDTDE